MEIVLIGIWRSSVACLVNLLKRGSGAVSKIHIFFKDFSLSCSFFEIGADNIENTLIYRGVIKKTAG